MGRKVFFRTFFITLSIMLVCYGILYMIIDGRSKPVGKNRQGIPITRQPAPGDSATVMVAAGDENRRYFFLIKFNGYRGKVSVTSISPSYILPSKGRNLTRSMEKAGVMQRVLDVKEEFGINVDYYINADWDGMRNLLEDFCEFGIEELGRQLPVVIQNFLLKSARAIDRNSLINAAEMAAGFLDNEIGLAFLNESVYRLLKYNGDNIHRFVGQQLKKGYSNIDTNINTEGMKKFERILNFIDPKVTEYLRRVVTKDETRRREIIRECVLE